VVTNVIIIVTLAVLAGVYISWRAGRLDRLHTRVETARAALDAALVRRSSVALELAACGLLDPATSLLLAGAAHDARAAGGPAEAAGAAELAESDLTRALRAALGQPGFGAAVGARDVAGELLAELEAAAHQVFLARKFYNDAVAATLDARRRWLVRLLRLAGSAPLPQFFEIDDSLVTGDGDVRGTDMPHLTGRPAGPAAAGGKPGEAGGKPGEAGGKPGEAGGKPGEAGGKPGKESGESPAGSRAARP
jgi:hypothetical protein